MAYEPAPDNLDLVLEKSVGLPHVDGFDWEIKRTLQSLLPGVRYSIRVRAYNHFNVYSGWSDALEFTAPFDTGRPVAITGLHSTYETADIIAAWHAPTRTTDDKTCNNIDHYEVLLEFKDGSGGLQITRTYISAITNFTLGFYQQLLDNETVYPIVDITVTAVTTSDSRSDPVTITVTNSPPSVLPFESVSPSTSGIQIVMNVPNTVLDFDHFVLESSPNHNGPWTEIYSGSSDVYTDVFLEATFRYYRHYVVDKLDQESVPSDVRGAESLSPFAGSVAMSDLTDVDLTGLLQPSVLEWNGTAWVPVQYNILSTENVQDIIGALLVEGDNVTLDYDDAGNTLTISSTGGGGGGVDLEELQDAVAAMLQEGDNITLTYNDIAGTLVIDSTGSGAALSFSAVVGDGVTTDITVVHDLGTENFVFSMFDYTTSQSVLNEQVTIIDENTIEINFGAAPDLNSRKIVIVAANSVTDAHLYPLEDLYPLETLYPLG